VFSTRAATVETLFRFASHVRTVLDSRKARAISVYFAACFAIGLALFYRKVEGNPTGVRPEVMGAFVLVWIVAVVALRENIKNLYSHHYVAFGERSYRWKDDSEGKD
jgi:hypothetical protein